MRNLKNSGNFVSLFFFLSGVAMEKATPLHDDLAYTKKYATEVKHHIIPLLMHMDVQEFLCTYPHHQLSRQLLHFMRGCVEFELTSPGVNAVKESKDNNYSLLLRNLMRKNLGKEPLTRHVEMQEEMIQLYERYQAELREVIDKNIISFVYHHNSADEHAAMMHRYLTLVVADAVEYSHEMTQLINIGFFYTHSNRCNTLDRLRYIQTGMGYNITPARPHAENTSAQKEWNRIYREIIKKVHGQEKSAQVVIS